MGTIIRNAIHLLSVIIICFCIYVIYFITNSRLDLPDYEFKLFNSNNAGVYSIQSENTIICDMQTLSYIVQRMKEDSYKIEKQTQSRDSIDVILYKDKCRYRLIYTKDRNLFIIASPYENSYIPLTYINE